MSEKSIEELEKEIEWKDRFIKQLQDLVVYIEGELNEIKIKNEKEKPLTQKERADSVRSANMHGAMFDYLISSGVSSDIATAACWMTGHGLISEIMKTESEEIEKLFEALSWKFEE